MPEPSGPPTADNSRHNTVSPFPGSEIRQSVLCPDFCVEQRAVEVKEALERM